MTILGRVLLVVILVLPTACAVQPVPLPAPPLEPPSLDGEGQILVVGDWGSGTDSQREVAAQMEAYAEGEAIAAILTTGDNLYSNNVDTLMEPFSWATDSGIPFLIAWGNHDVETRRRIELVNETFGDPPRWSSAEWGPIDLIILDSTETDSVLQSQFLVETMAARDDPTVVVFHHPPYSCSTHGGSQQILEEWVPQFDNDVFLVLNGHEHNYQRFEADGVTYVVTGGGGRTLYDVDECTADHPERLAEEVVYHFVALELAETLSVTAIDADGNVIDEFALPVSRPTPTTGPTG